MFPVPGPLSGWLHSRWGKRVLIDLLVIAGFALLVRVVTFDMDLFERVHEFSRQHEAAEIDEWVVTAVIASLALVTFGIRRVQDQRRELALRLSAEQHATMLALQDQLTGLANRRRFHDALSSELSTGASHALILLDLDGFKQVNDVFGHAAGDEALKTVAGRLRAISDARVLPARLGGDEFALLIRNVRQIEDATAVAQAVIAAIDAPIMTAGAEQHLHVSLGIAIIGGDGAPAEEYLRRADTALYRSKRKQGSAFAVYETSMDDELTERVRIERDLRDALAKHAIVPYYQPIVDLGTGSILKFEALARWRDPQRGNVSPAIFIPIAEERGLIAELTESILEQACRTARAWPSHIRLTVNLSPALIRTAFGLRIARVLAETGLPPSRLEIEIKEAALDSNVNDVRAFFESVRSLGVHVSLDDFGSGYSSLSRLRLFAIDGLKIDGGFVQSMSESEDRLLFVRTILELGRGLGLTVTAEGIENLDQRELLVSEGCAQGQGFLFSEAVPAERVRELLERQNAVAAAG